MASNFIDYVKIYMRSGHGGAGSRHFHREKFNAKGGPDGGNGGRGGHIILKGNAQMWTLLPLKYRKHIRCENGQNGAEALKTGKDGADIVIEVPLGTVAKKEDGETLLEITENGEEKILLAGGKGGLGNAHFKSSTNQAPQYAQPGIPGIEETIILELKLLADVGLVGFPNAGKSTLLSVVSAAKPEIADYPFTTLTPNLGIVSVDDFQTFVMADIPGLIEGASEGKGLGHRFLRHIERNSILLFVISVEELDVVNHFQTLQNELIKFNPELKYKDYMIAITKKDLIDDQIQQELEIQLKKHLKVPYLFISSVAQSGLLELKRKLWQMLQVEID